MFRAEHGQRAAGPFGAPSGTRARATPPALHSERISGRPHRPVRQIDRGQGGLLDVALDPDFSSNRLVDVEQDPDGALLVLTDHDNGELLRLTRPRAR
jgi:glucose/arabinose dehydrogenase